MTPSNSARTLLIGVVLLLSACTEITPRLLPEPLVPPHQDARAGQLVQLDGGRPSAAEATAPATQIQATPTPPPASKLSSVQPATPVPDRKEEASITVAFDQMPLPNFVQAIYGLILKKTFSMDAQVAARKDLVTLRASALQTPSQIETAARLLLKTYGVAVSDLGAGNYRVAPDNTLTGYAPEIMRGRALPAVPLALRPIYQLVELQAVRSSELVSWLSKIYGSKIGIIDDAANNTLILSGQSDDVASVLAAIHILDQPTMKGRSSLRINPVYWSAEDLSKKIVDLLTAEGYRASNNAAGNVPINLIPIAGINAIIVFAADPAVMQHITDWAKDFDKPNLTHGSGGGYFTYKVRYTNADNLAKTMQAVLGEPQSAAPAAKIPPGAIVVGPPAKASAPSGRVIVNPATNTLIFQGSDQNNTQLLTLLQELDQPAKSALIEVTVAEVTLDDTTQLGVEWALGAAGAKYTGGTIAGVPLGAGLTSGGLSIATAGLSIARLGSAGDIRALLNMLATSTKANVLSSPRILARNGETATIQVGSEIPTINMQQTNAATAGVGVLQSVEYRKTGVILTVKPIIYAGDRIDLDVTQEVSDSTKVGVAGSPIIDTRKVQTQLSLKDGTAVLLGGLISQSNSRSETGVPFLKDIPVAGQLFRTNTDNLSKTELLVLITPYIVADDHDAQEITNAFRNRLGEWARSTSTTVPAAPAPASAPQ